MKRSRIALVTVALLAGCSRSPGPDSAPSSSRPVQPQSSTTTARSGDDQEVYEAVFRWQFQHNSSGAQQDATAFFLSINKADPSAEFLQRFADHQPPVEPGSRFKKGAGLLFRIDGIEWIDEHNAEVSGGYYEAELSASGNTYRVIRKEDKWVVEGEQMHWIS